MAIFDRIEQWDKTLFLALNGAHSNAVDAVMVWISNPLFWVPLYLLLLYLVYRSNNIKAVLVTLLSAGLVVLLCDRISVLAFKNVFGRYRPCHNLEFGHLVHTVNDYCAGMYGFVSSHACNFFGIAVLMAFILKGYYKYPFLLLLLWAALIGYSRIYLGVHYPADVTCGALLGCIFGWVGFWFYKFALLKLNSKPV